MKIITNSILMFAIVFFASCALTQVYQFENPIAGPEHPECKNQELVAFGGTAYCIE